MHPPDSKSAAEPVHPNAPPAQAQRRRFDFRIRPLAYSAIAAAAGVLAVELCFRGTYISAVALAAAAALSAAVVILQEKRLRLRAAAVLAVFACAGASSAAFALFYWPSEHVRFLPLDDRTKGTLVGIVCEEPLIRPEVQETPTWPRKPVARFLVNAEEIRLDNSTHAATGLVQATVYESPPRIRYGDRVQIRASFRKYNPPSNDGGLDYRLYMERRGIFLSANVKTGADVSVIGRDEGGFFPSVVAAARRGLRDVLYATCDRGAADLLATLLLGYRSAVEGKREEMYLKTGTMHLLAVSGLHIVLFAGFVLLVLRGIGTPRKITIFAGIAAAVFYSLMAGWQAPVVRSAIMMVLYLSVELFYRRRDALNILGLSAVFILIADPNQLMSAGFQLSYAAVAGIILIYPALVSLSSADSDLERRLEEKTALPWWRKYAVNPAVASARVSAAAFIATAPLALYHFHIFAPAALIVNVIIYPFIWAIISLGFLGAFAGAVFSSAGAMLQTLNSWIIGAFEDILRYAADTGFYAFFADQGAVKIAAVYALIALALFGRGVGVRAVHTAALVLVFIAAALGFDAVKKSGSEVSVTFLDAGRGLAVYVELPSGGNLLYDCGSPGLADAGETAAALLWRRGRTTLDALVLSHGDMDHVNGVNALSCRIKIKRAYIGPGFASGASAGEMLETLKQRGIPVEEISAPARLEALGFGVRAVYPPPGETPNARAAPNDASLVIMIEAFGKRVLLTGDAQDFPCVAMKYLHADIKADVVSIPHHGGKMVFSEDLAGMVGASYAVASSRIASPPAAGSWENAGAKVYTTAESGAITFRISEAGISVEEFLKRAEK
jgi:competence protein ComEC